MDGDSSAVVVFVYEGQAARLADTNPQNDQFCCGEVPVNDGRPVGIFALKTRVGVRSCSLSIIRVPKLSIPHATKFLLK